MAQTTSGTTTRYTQDLATPLSQVLQRTVGGTTTNYLYGTERLAAASGATPTTWYLTDALGSVRRTLTANGTPQAPLSYDPWGTPEGGVTPPTFGFTGELQDAAAGLVYLRARWYTPQRGTFTSRDSFAGFPTQPYSLHPYQYGYSNPVLLTDPTGKCTFAGSHITDIKRLDCTISRFETLSANARLDWMDTFMRAYQVEGWFNNVKDIISYFSESPALRHLARGSWASWSDAGVLAAIQDGMSLYNYRRSVNGIGDPARNWSAFFAKVHNTSVSNDEKKRLWGHAEQSGVNFGVALADRKAGRPSVFTKDAEGRVIEAFIIAGNIYRGLDQMSHGGGFTGAYIGSVFIPGCVLGALAGYHTGEWFTTASSQIPFANHGPTHYAAWYIELEVTFGETWGGSLSPI